MLLPMEGGRDLEISIPQQDYGSVYSIFYNSSPEIHEVTTETLQARQLSQWIGRENSQANQKA